MKLSEMSDAELGAMCRDRDARLAEAYDMGLTDEHPATRWNADNKILRDHAAAKARDSSSSTSQSLPGNVGEAKEIMDEERETEGSPAKQRQGELEVDRRRAAHDRAIAEDNAIRASGLNVDERLIEARNRRINWDDVRAAARIIPGYTRLG